MPSLTSMAKRKLKVHFRLPAYVAPRNVWRGLIYDAAQTAMKIKEVNYDPTDALAVEIILYLRKSAFAVHDVDNRLKDVLDALQGRMGGPKAIRRYAPLIYNDNQVCSVVIRKMLPPPQSHTLGHVTIRQYRIPVTSRGL